MGINNIDLLKPNNDYAVQPVVTYDGRIIPKEVELDADGKAIPDPSWVAFVKDMSEGKFKKE